MPRTRSVLVLAIGLSLVSFTAFAKPELPTPFAQARVDAVLANAVDREQIDFVAGTEASHCVPSTTNTHLCQWSLGNRHAGWKPLAKALDTRVRIALICELPNSGAPRAAKSCTAYPMRSNRDEFRLGNLGTGGRRSAAAGVMADKREEYQHIAATWIGSARTVEEMSRLMGAVPRLCVPTKGAYQNCRWRTSSKMMGHGTVAAWTGVSSRKRIRLDCTFPLSGEPREHDCLAEIGG